MRRWVSDGKEEVNASEGQEEVKVGVGGSLGWWETDKAQKEWSMVSLGRLDPTHWCPSFLCLKHALRSLDVKGHLAQTMGTPVAKDESRRTERLPRMCYSA